MRINPYGGKASAFGRAIGGLLGGGDEAGRLINLIAPVVPFIYMEIVLEAMIKGMGLQNFSSLNYLAEYAVRITIVLLFVPKFGLYGVAASYYTSNVFGNCSRFVRLLRASGMKFRPVRMMILPILYAFLSMGTAELICRLLPMGNTNVLFMVIFTVLWGIIYGGIMLFTEKIRLFDKCREVIVVESAQ